MNRFGVGAGLRTLVMISCAGIVAGCNNQPQAPVNMAPPIGSSQNMGQPQPQGYAGQQGAPGYQQNGSQQPSADVYQWQDVPQNQQVQVTRATFDQGGYQLFANSGETIVVPFVNQNLYAMKFGRTNGQPYFINDGQAPTLYLPPGGYLENAAAQNARWYPIPQDYNYTQPMYVSLAPSWSEYTGMGWYPGMNYYGGMWGYTPYSSFAWMPGFYIGIGTSRYTTFTSYHSYYVSNPGYSRVSTVYRNYSTPRGATFGSRRVVGSQGSFNSGRSGFGTRSTFGSPASSSSGSFGTRGVTRPSGGSTGGFSRPSGSFSSGGRQSGSSFGGNRSSGGSFGGRSSGGSFGGRRR